MTRTVIAVKAQVWSRVVGFFRPVENWNLGKREEFKDRYTHRIQTAEDFTKVVLDTPDSVSIFEVAEGGTNHDHDTNTFRSGPGGTPCELPSATGAGSHDEKEMR